MPKPGGCGEGGPFDEGGPFGPPYGQQKKHDDDQGGKGRQGRNVDKALAKIQADLAAAAHLDKRNAKAIRSKLNQVLDLLRLILAKLESGTEPDTATNVAIKLGQPTLKP